MSNNFRAIIGILAIIIPSLGYSQMPQGEKLMITLPKNFKVGANLSRDKNTYVEYVPADQTVNEWTDMVTVQIFRGLNLTPADLLQKVGGRIIQRCPDTVSSQNIISGTVNGYPVSMLDLKCPNNPETSKPETILFRVIKGQEAIYSVQYAWRSIPTSEQWQLASNILGKVSVCDSRSSDHPCPSLTPLRP